MERIYNFSSGPAVMPEPVLERARDEMMSLGGVGVSVMEMSHRSRHFGRVLDAAERGIRDLLRLPENYRVLFLQGGATLEQIRAAHRSLMKQLHPDQGGTVERAARVNAARDRLTDRHR